MENARDTQQPGRTTRLVRVQDRGQVTLPVEIRRKYNIREGDLIGFRETKEGILIDLRATEIIKALDKIGEMLREKGETLESMMESGEQIREELYQELYGKQEARGDA